MPGYARNATTETGEAGVGIRVGAIVAVVEAGDARTGERKPRVTGSVAQEPRHPQAPPAVEISALPAPPEIKGQHPAETVLATVADKAEDAGKNAAPASPSGWILFRPATN